MSHEVGGAPPDRSARWLLVPMVALMLVFLASMLTLMALPPWHRSWWLFALLIASLAGFMALSITVRLRRFRRRPAPAAGIRVQPRTGLILLHVFVGLGIVIYLVVAGQAVVAASGLGAHPGQTVATRVLQPSCSRCNTRVQYQVGNEIWTATLGSEISTPSTGDRALRLVYDPDHPYRVMTYSDWQDGRGSARWGLLGATLGGLGWTMLWTALGRRRRRRLNALRPDVPIVAAQQRGKSRRATRAWRTFADGKRVTYLGTPELRRAVHDRLAASGSIGTLSEDDRQLLATAVNGHDLDPRRLVGRESSADLTDRT